MADTFKFQKDWYESIINNPYVKTSPQEMAYILYAAMQYAFNDGAPIDIGEVFGPEFGGLNRDMPNIYGQMDKIKNYEKGKKEDVYDHEAIYKLRMEGKTGKEICLALGYSLSKVNSLTTTKGWKKAKEEMEKNAVQNTESVQKSVKNTENIQKSVQNCTDTDTDRY